MNRFGFELLLEQTLDHVSSELDWMLHETVGDSEIEKLLFMALHARTRFWSAQHRELVVVSNDDSSILDASPLPQFFSALFIWPQARIDQYRVDFLIFAADWKSFPKLGEEKWRRLIVECDGHNFHERTKEQATRDRSRDRDLTLQGYTVFRFTGSEIWRDPWGVVDNIFSWASEGWPEK